MPLVNTRMIPPRWQEHHARVVLGGMTAWVRLSHPAGLGTRDAVTGRTPTLPPTRYYEGPARLQTRGALTDAASTAAREVSVGDYLLGVPIDVGSEPRIADLCDVLDSPDPLEVGMRLYLVDVPTASIILQRNLGADLHMPTPRGG
jgi:hypothetical protein